MVIVMELPVEANTPSDSPKESEDGVTENEGAGLTLRYAASDG